MAERDAAPAGWFASQHSGGAGAPPEATKSLCQELADTRLLSIAGAAQSAARRRINAADDAPEGGCVHASGRSIKRTTLRLPAHRRPSLNPHRAGTMARGCLILKSAFLFTSPRRPHVWPIVRILTTRRIRS
ncbi:hypothetical protein DFP91_5724 [Pseudorhodoplanes sinuspersici]|nr:hypothetical protein DFP91_5724 [Pseudorhodoplanes sinuspersici]